MVLKATVQKESPIQLLPKITSETAVLTTALTACNFILKRLQHMCFPMNIAKCLQTAHFCGNLQWLLLSV